MNLHQKEFLEVHGDPNWLKGLDFIPPKLRAIYDINKILAHRPWLLSKEHIEVCIFQIKMHKKLKCKIIMLFHFICSV